VVGSRKVERAGCRTPAAKPRLEGTDGGYKSEGTNSRVNSTRSRQQSYTSTGMAGVGGAGSGGGGRGGGRAYDDVPPQRGRRMFLTRTRKAQLLGHGGGQFTRVRRHFCCAAHVPQQLPLGQLARQQRTVHAPTAPGVQYVAAEHGVRLRQRLRPVGSVCMGGRGRAAREWGKGGGGNAAAALPPGVDGGASCTPSSPCWRTTPPTQEGVRSIAW
jgi:hypothetical protein